MDTSSVSNVNEKESTKCVYFLRKRPRLSSTIHISKSETRCVFTTVFRRKTPIMFMPTEILQKILSFFTNEELAKSIRLINRRFRTIAQFLLNNHFFRLKVRLDSLKKMIDASMPHTNDDIELRCLCKMLSVLEILIFYHSLLSSTIGRYIYYKKIPSNVCMYAGTILDLYNKVLNDFIKEPHRIYCPIIAKDYNLPKDVKDICISVKTFTIYFDRFTEMSLNDCGFYTGCKLLDILDTATDAKRTVLSQRLVGNTLTLKVKYYFSNSWFVALDINDEKPKIWIEQQRLMYMRLRRIVISHSEMSMEYNQFKREIMVRTDPKPRIRRPINSVYTGYGEVGDKFFYYGVMNEGAYINKFVMDEASVNSSYDSLDDKLRSSYLGLDIFVEVRCPIQLAPYRVVEEYQNENENFIEEKYILAPKKRLRGLLELKVDFQCPSAIYPRLPTIYRYYVRNQK